MLTVEFTLYLLELKEPALLCHQYNKLSLSSEKGLFVSARQEAIFPHLEFYSLWSGHRYPWHLTYVSHVSFFNEHTFLFWGKPKPLGPNSFICWVRSAGSFSSCHLTPPFLFPKWTSICPSLLIVNHHALTICGFTIHTPCCNTKGQERKRKEQNKRHPMSILLGLYSGLSLEHKGQWEALNVCTLSSTDDSKFSLFLSCHSFFLFFFQNSLFLAVRERGDLYIVMSEISSGWYLNIQEKETHCVQGQMNISFFPSTFAPYSLRLQVFF